MLQEQNAIREATKLHIPIIALADTNANPSQATYAIPANDDAVKTIELIASYLKQAIELGQSKQTKTADKAEEKIENN
jgi:small subunit ribosomal protein S2